MGIQTLCRVLAAAAVLGAAMSATASFSLEFVDRTGVRIACGTPLHPTLDIATKEDAINAQQHTARGPNFVLSDYASQCSTIIDGRRNIAMSVAAVGAMIGLASFYRGSRQPGHATSPGRHRVQTAPAALFPRYSTVDVAVREPTEPSLPDRARVRQPVAAQAV
jgi:hypothetical protein